MDVGKTILELVRDVFPLNRIKVVHNDECVIIRVKLTSILDIFRAVSMVDKEREFLFSVLGLFPSVYWRVYEDIDDSDRADFLEFVGNNTFVFTRRVDVDDLRGIELVMCYGVWMLYASEHPLVFQDSKENDIFNVDFLRSLLVNKLVDMLIVSIYDNIEWHIGVMLEGGSRVDDILA